MADCKTPWTSEGNLDAGCVEKAVNVTCERLRRHLVAQESKLIGGRVKRDRSGFLNHEPSDKASGFDHVEMVEVQLTAAARACSESQSPNRSTLSTELSTYRNALKRAISARQALESTRDAGQNERAARQRLARSETSLQLRLSQLCAEAREALDGAQQSVHATYPSSDYLTERLQAAELAIERIESEGPSMNPAREVARTAASSVSYLDPIGWRQIVRLFVTELGFTCPDPTVNPARFDEFLGAAWVTNNTISLSRGWRPQRSGPPG